jgi:hypothetical protein
MVRATIPRQAKEPSPSRTRRRPDIRRDGIMGIGPTIRTSQKPTRTCTSHCVYFGIAFAFPSFAVG